MRTRDDANVSYRPKEKVDRVLSLAEPARACDEQLGEGASFDAIWRVFD